MQLHPTSLPGGRLGTEANTFVDWLPAGGRAWAVEGTGSYGAGLARYLFVGQVVLGSRTSFGPYGRGWGCARARPDIISREYTPTPDRFFPRL